MEKYVTSKSYGLFYMSFGNFSDVANPVIYWTSMVLHANPWFTRQSTVHIAQIISIFLAEIERLCCG